MINLFDVVCILILVWLSISGLYKGIIKLSINNISFIVSLILSSALFPLMQDVLNEYIKSKIAINLLAAGLSYILSLIVCSVIAQKIKTLVSPICGGILDKVGGFALGVTNGFILNVIIFCIVAVLATGKYLNTDLFQLLDKLDKEQCPRWLQKAASFDFFDNTLRYLINLEPIKTGLEEIKLDQNKTNVESNTELQDFLANE